MRIAQVAVPFESVPPAGYGGTERVVATQCNQLVRRGHDVPGLPPGSLARRRPWCRWWSRRSGTASQSGVTRRWSATCITTTSHQEVDW
jgi:hypothetical protein